jgi:hypothetical protein
MRDILKLRDSFPPVMRYNGGFQDGKDDRLYHRQMRYLPTTFHQDRPLPTWDKQYCKGYNDGFNS